ncbi:MAG: lytic murein transglycosylase [Patescibacteria group bacterium]
MKKTLSIILAISLLISVVPTSVAEDSFCVEAEKATKEKDCDTLAAINGDNVKKKCSDIFNKFSTELNTCLSNAQKEKDELESQINNIEKKESSAEWYLSKLNLDIRYLNYEIANLDLSISQLESEIEKREKAVKELDEALAEQKGVLQNAIRQFYEYDTTSYVEVLLGNGSLSEFGNKLMEIDKVQTELRLAMKEIQKARDKMDSEKSAMEKDIEEKTEYKKVQEYSIYSLANKTEQQKYLLGQLAAAKTPLEKEMARIKSELSELSNAMARIQSYLTGWLGYRPSWSQIWTAVSNASNKAGINKFTMLGILEVESGFRTNAGSNAGSPEGNLQRCHDYRVNDEPFCTNQKNEFEDICAELNLDKNKMPISVAYAMGPAQFIPTTWRGYQNMYPELRNPWNLNDAVLAMAYKLKRGGGVAGYNPGGASWYVPRVNAAASRWQEIYNACNGFDLSCPNLKNYLESKGIPAE